MELEPLEQIRPLECNAIRRPGMDLQIIKSVEAEGLAKLLRGAEDNRVIKENSSFLNDLAD